MNFWQDVMLVQYLINSAWDAGLVCDGSYGPKTAKAIRDTQRAFRNVKVDGKVNLSNGKKLYSSVSNTMYTIFALNGSLRNFSPLIYDNITIDRNLPAILRAELLSEVYDI
jgi:peptidoglycan hydrolase-like protein with peptidoglycan-binding domain